MLHSLLAVFTLLFCWASSFVRAQVPWHYMQRACHTPQGMLSLTVLLEMLPSRSRVTAACAWLCPARRLTHGIVSWLGCPGLGCLLHQLQALSLFIPAQSVLRSIDSVASACAAKLPFMVLPWAQCTGVSEGVICPAHRQRWRLANQHMWRYSTQ